MAGQFDVSIIGSGTGGETLARHLAPSGKSILLLEVYGAALFYFSRGSQPPRSSTRRV